MNGSSGKMRSYAAVASCSLGVWCKTIVNLFCLKTHNLSSYLNVCGFVLKEAFPQDAVLKGLCSFSKQDYRVGRGGVSLKIGKFTPYFNFLCNNDKVN